jgi:integrase
MTGSVIRRGDTWAVKYDLDPDPVTGRRRQKMVSGYPDRDLAKKELRRILADLDQGVHVDPSRQTVGNFLIEDWLPSISPTVRPSTLHSYRRNLEQHVIAHIGGVRLVKLDPVGLNRLYALLLAEGRRDRPGELSPRTVRYVHTIIHRALKDAVRWGRLARNVADAADPPRITAGRRREVDAWPRETLAEFLGRSEGYGDRYYPLWVMLATTGARRGEILGLRWSDVNLEAGRAAIRQTVIAVKHEIRFGTPKTAKGRRSVSLDPGTVRVLKEWRRRQLEEKVLLGPGYDDHDLVFPKVTGEPLHPERVSREFDRRVERWQLPKLTLHGLRHTWATLALASGVHPKVVQERLGHSVIAVTLDLYSHTTPTLHDQAAELVAGQILG